MPRTLRRPIQGFLFLTFAALLGCTAIQPIDDRQEAFLELLVVPDTAEIFIDDEYVGVVNRWARQTVPVEAGYRRLELRADGYLTQRFDLDVTPGNMHTLRVRMEPDSHLGPDLDAEDRASDEEDQW